MVIEHPVSKPTSCSRSLADSGASSSSRTWATTFSRRLSVRLPAAVMLMMLRLLSSGSGLRRTNSPGQVVEGRDEVTRVNTAAASEGRPGSPEVVTTQ